MYSKIALCAQHIRNSMEKERHIFDFDVMMKSAYTKLNYIRSPQTTNKKNWLLQTSNERQQQQWKPWWRVNMQEKIHIACVPCVCNDSKIGGIFSFSIFFFFVVALVVGLAGIFKSIYHFSLFFQPKTLYFSKTCQAIIFRAANNTITHCIKRAKISALFWKQKKNESPCKR